MRLMETMKDYREQLLECISDSNGQLNNLTFELREFKGYTLGDHSHCELCWAVISDIDDPEYFNEGYYCCETHVWLCKQCFQDFAQRFGWRIVKNNQYYTVCL